MKNVKIVNVEDVPEITKSIINSECENIRNKLSTIILKTTQRVGKSTLNGNEAFNAFHTIMEFACAYILLHVFQAVNEMEIGLSFDETRDLLFESIDEAMKDMIKNRKSAAH